MLKQVPLGAPFPNAPNSFIAGFKYPQLIILG
jgi:hypothetical protein